MQPGRSHIASVGHIVKLWQTRHHCVEPTDLSAQMATPHDYIVATILSI